MRNKGVFSFLVQSRSLEILHNSDGSSLFILCTYSSAIPVMSFQTRLSYGGRSVKTVKLLGKCKYLSSFASPVELFANILTVNKNV